MIYWTEPEGQELLVLVLKRNHIGEKEGLWQPVTGNVDEGESYEEAALREVKEETSFTSPQTLQDMDMEYKFSGRWGEANEKVFALKVEGEKAPAPKLDKKEHCDYAWKNPVEVHSLFPFPKQKEAVFKAFYKPNPFFLDKDGVWFQEGEEITHQRSSDLLHHSLEKGEKEGEFLIRTEDSSVPAIIESTPLHISGVALEKEMLLLMPHGDRKFPLDPKSLIMDKAHILYCTINGMKAKFSRQAYYELCKRIAEKKSAKGGVEYFLHWGGEDYLIPVTH